jgi:hypothetical protein
MTPRKLLVATAMMASVVTTACSDMTAPTKLVPGESSASFRRSGALYVTKECSEYTLLAGSFCTITSSNLKQIEVGTRVVYAEAAGLTSLDTDVILDPPGPGNNIAFGHVKLDLSTGYGEATFSGGTGKFRNFHARVDVLPLGWPNWAWDGTYSFSPPD